MIITSVASLNQAHDDVLNPECKINMAGKLSDKTFFSSEYLGWILTLRKSVRMLLSRYGILIVLYNYRQVNVFDDL